MKSAAREEKTKQRQNTFATGGGPRQEVDYSVIDDVASIAPHLMTSITPTVDSEFLPPKQRGMQNTFSTCCVFQCFDLV